MFPVKTNDCGKVCWEEKVQVFDRKKPNINPRENEEKGNKPGLEQTSPKKMAKISFTGKTKNPSEQSGKDWKKEQKTLPHNKKGEIRK